MTKRTTRRVTRPSLFKYALVVAKKTYLQEVQEQQDQRVLDLIAQGHPSVANVVPAHEEHTASLATVERELAALGVSHTTVHRELMEKELATGKYDLVITVGGDGTTLDASHYVADDIPIFGVNSAPTSSHGHWCVGNKTNFSSELLKVITGKRKPLKVMRLLLLLDGKPIPQRVLNEVLIAHAVIGATSRYLVRINGKSEEHKSDGLFFGAPGGSTGWMRSYGAKLLPIKSQRIQYLTRGLIVPPGKSYRLTKGLLPSATVITVLSEMPDGKLYVDGQHTQYPFPRGSELTISRSPQDLHLFADATVNQRYEAPVGKRPSAPPRKQRGRRAARTPDAHDRWVGGIATK